MGSPIGAREARELFTASYQSKKALQEPFSCPGNDAWTEEIRHRPLSNAGPRILTYQKRRPLHEPCSQLRASECLSAKRSLLHPRKNKLTSNASCNHRDGADGSVRNKTSCLKKIPCRQKRNWGHRHGDSSLVGYNGYWVQPEFPNSPLITVISTHPNRRWLTQPLIHPHHHRTGGCTTLC